MPPAGFELEMPAGEWLQTHALDRSATGIGKNYIYDKLVNKFPRVSWKPNVLNDSPALDPVMNQLNIFKIHF